MVRIHVMGLAVLDTECALPTPQPPPIGPIPWSQQLESLWFGGWKTSFIKAFTQCPLLKNQ